MSILEVEPLRTAATGRWVELLTRAGIPSGALDGRGHPCPKCGGRDRFAAFAKIELRGAVHCRRCFTAGSPISPGDGIQTLRWWTGHSFVETLQWMNAALGGYAAGAYVGVAASQPRRTPADPGLIEALTREAREAFERMDESIRDRTARSLGVSPKSLFRLRVGISIDGSYTTWPMRDAAFRVIGIRFAAVPWGSESGRKWSRPGSRSGLFIPRNRIADPTRLWVTEGATDTAAASTLGLWVVGRSSCTSSSGVVEDYAVRNAAHRVSIIADHDEAGRAGALRLNATLAAAGLRAEVIVAPPDAKDLRGWLRSGIDAAGLLAARPLKESSRPVQMQLRLT